eukprot:scaffold1307_cov166-Ochromonas_danica.AAC.7
MRKDLIRTYRHTVYKDQNEGKRQKETLRLGIEPRSPALSKERGAPFDRRTVPTVKFWLMMWFGNGMIMRY